MIRIIFIIFTLLFIFSCKKKEIGPQCPTCEEEVTPTTTDVLIGCEGNFGWGNSSITQYQPTSGVVTQQVFQNVNSFSLGDVLQSFCSWQNKLYIVMNNSGKIEIIDTVSYLYQGTITGLNSPRYMVTSGNTGYVSDLYSNGVSVVDLASNQVTDTITVGRWSEHLLISGNDLYIGCPDTTWVLKYDLTSNMFTDTIIVGKSPSGIQQSNDGHIWTLTSGGYNQEVPNLVEYDGNNIIKILNFNSVADNPSQLIYNSKNGVFYFLNNGVFTYNPDDNSLPNSPIISPNGSIFYGLGIDPKNSDIYVTDAVDYVQQGKVLRFDSLYNPVDTFSTGIIPQAIWFK